MSSTAPKRDTPRAPVVRAVVITAALLAVVAVASRHALAGGKAPRPLQGGGYGWILDVLTAMMAVALGFGFVVYCVAMWPSSQRPARRKRSSRATLVVLAIAALLLELQLRYHLIHLHVVHRALRGLQPAGAGNPAAARRRGTPAASHVPWPVLLALIIAGVVAAVALLIGPVRAHEYEDLPDEEADTPEHIVAQAAWDSLEDLLREPDPRRAVVAAYARMERGLRQAGIPRRVSDTPVEYLTQAFDTLPAARPAAARLTALYQEAKFSHHEVPPTMRDEALQALRDLARSLEVAA